MPPTRNEGLERQLREREERVGDLTEQVQQRRLEKNEIIQRKDGEIEDLQQQLLRQHDVIQQRDEVIQQREGAIDHLQQQLRVRGRESEQVVAALQQSVEQKDTALQAKDNLLQEKEREIRELQQSLRGTSEGDVATAHLKLEWRDGPRAPCFTFGASVAVSREVAYFCDSASNSKVLMYNS